MNKWPVKMSQEIKNLIKWVLIWRLGLLAAAAVALRYIGYLFPYPEFERLIQRGHNIPLIWAWGAFDGVHYITIAESGYIADNTQAFFPMFPYVSGVIHKALNVDTLFSGLILSNLAVILAIVLFWKLVRLDYGNKTTKVIMSLLLLFPTSYYLGAVYSESFFLALTFGTLLLVRKGKWLAAGILGALASATRPIGVFLFFALLVENWQQLKEKKKKISGLDELRTVFFILLVPLGLIFYMIYLQNHFGDALKFLHAQPAFGASRSDRIVLLYQTVWRYFKMMLTVDFRSLLFYRVMQEFLWSMIFAVLGIVCFWKTRLSYAVFAFLCFLAPTLTGTFSSMPRYVLVMFPVFILAGGWLSKYDRLRPIWYLISGIWLIINMSLFLTGRWVA